MDRYLTELFELHIYIPSQPPMTTAKMRRTTFFLTLLVPLGIVHELSYLFIVLIVYFIRRNLV